MDRTRAAILALLLVLPLLPSGTAQTGTNTSSETRIQVFDPDARLAPGETTVLLTAVTYRYGQGARADQPTEVELSVLSTPDWAEAAFNRTTVTFPVPASSASSGRTDQERVELDVTLDPDAPAFAEGVVEVRAQAEENGNIESSEGTDEQEIPPAYDATLEVDHRNPVAVPGGRRTVLSLHVQVDANGPTRLDTRLQAKPANSKVTTPSPVDLAAPGAGNASALMELEVRMPWTRNQEGDLTLELVPAHASETSVLGTPSTATVTLVGQSLVPGPGAVLAVLSAAGVARALARRP